MELMLRPSADADWPRILDLANESAAWAGDQNLQWLHNRQRAGQNGFVRHHYVVEDGSSHNVVGYGAIEGGPETGIFRMFIVMSPERLMSGVGQYLYDHLYQTLTALHATKLWAREEDGDLLIPFFRTQQFTETQRFPGPGGRDIVVLEHHL